MVFTEFCFGGGSGNFVVFNSCFSDDILEVFVASVCYDWFGLVKS